MKVQPVGDHIVVRRLEPDETSTGGILLPEASRERSQEGRVVSVGDGRLLRDGTRVPHQVQEGDRVLLSRWAGVEIEVADEWLLIVNEEQILAVLD